MDFPNFNKNIFLEQELKRMGLLETDEINQKKKDNELFCSLVLSGDKTINRLKELLATGANINATNNWGKTLLIVSATFNYFDVVDFLIKNHANLAARDIFKNTALSTAVKHKHHKVIYQLFSVMKVQEIEKEIAYHSEIEPYFNLYLKNKELQLEKESSEAFIQAIKRVLCSEALEKLIKEKKRENIYLNLELTDDEGYTPLLWAAINNYTEQAALLIKYKVNLEARCSQGKTPLIWAAYNENLELLHLLIQAKANPHAVAKNGWTAIAWAAYKANVEVMRLLIEQNVDVNGTIDGPVPLIFAAARGKVEAIDLLIDAGADIEKTHKGDTALSAAIICDNYKATSRILKSMSSEQISNFFDADYDRIFIANLFKNDFVCKSNLSLLFSRLSIDDSPGYFPSMPKLTPTKIKYRNPQPNPHKRPKPRK